MTFFLKNKSITPVLPSFRLTKRQLVPSSEFFSSLTISFIQASSPCTFPTISSLPIGQEMNANPETVPAVLLPSAIGIIIVGHRYNYRSLLIQVSLTDDSRIVRCTERPARQTTGIATENPLDSPYRLPVQPLRQKVACDGVVEVDRFGGVSPVFEPFHSVENTKFEFQNWNFPQCGKSQGKTIFPRFDN